MTIRELYQRIEGNYESAARIVPMERLIERLILLYAQDESCKKLLEARAAGDEKGIFEASHAMKGVCGNLGLDALAAEASRITEAFRPGEARTMDEAQLAESFARIEALQEKTLAGIAAYQAEKG